MKEDRSPLGKAHIFMILCPNCGHSSDMASGLGTNNYPVPGDVTICIRCSAPLWYEGRNKVHLITPGEIKSFSQEFRRKIEIGIIAVRNIPGWKPPDFTKPPPPEGSKH